MSLLDQACQELCKLLPLFIQPGSEPQSVPVDNVGDSILDFVLEVELAERAIGDVHFMVSNKNFNSFP